MKKLNNYSFTCSDMQKKNTFIHSNNSNLIPQKIKWLIKMHSYVTDVVSK